MRPGFLFAASLLVVAPSPAGAQLAPAELSDCVATGDQIVPLPGTPSWSMGAHLLFGTSALYGAVASLEQHIFPSLDFVQRLQLAEGKWGAGDDSEGAVAFHLAYKMAQEVRRIPMCGGRMSALDTIQQNIAGGYRMPVFGDDAFSLFYSMSIGWTTLIDDFDDANMTRLALPFGASFAPLVLVPYFTATGNDRLGAPPAGAISEWVAGLSYTKRLTLGSAATNITASAAFVSSSGSYLSLRESEFGLSIGTVLTADFQRPRYLFYGLQNVELFETLAFVSLYATRTDLVVPPVMPSKQVTVWYSDNFQEVSKEFPTVTQDIYVASVDNVAGYFDFEVAYMRKPEPQLRSGAVRLHLPSYHAPRVTTDALSRMELSADEVWLAGFAPFSLRAGFVSLPRYGYFSQEAQTLGFFEAEVAFLYLRYNSPEYLSQFPYATNLIQVGLEMTLQF